MPTTQLLRHLLLAVLGWILAWTFAWPWELNWSGLALHETAPILQFLTLVTVLYMLLRAPSRLASLRHTWWFATNWLAALTWWLVHAMTHYTNLPYVVAALAVVLLSAALAVYLALCVGGLFAWIESVLPKQRMLLALTCAAAWSLAEWLRGHWFTGFPWGELAYTHIDTLRGLATLVGSSGASAVLVFAASWWALWLHDKHDAKQAVIAGVLSVLLLMPSVYFSEWAPQWTQPTATTDVTLVQGNVRQDMKFDSSSAQVTEWYAQQIEQATTSLVVLPETAFVQPPERQSQALWEGIQTRLDQDQRAALIGMPLNTGEQSYSNAVKGLRPTGQPGFSYNKHHLVPFGEFVPAGFKWLTDAMNIPLGGFSAGSLDQAPMPWDGQQLAVQICYEDVFGDELAQRLWRTKGEPTAWVNVSNLAWFGNTAALSHHLTMARWRAIETGRPIVRATNTGATAIIDAKGHVTHQLEHNVRGQLVGTFTGHTGFTPYVQWAGRWGHTPVWLISIAVMLFASWRALSAQNRQ